MTLSSVLLALVFSLAALTSACDDGVDPEPSDTKDVSAILALTGDAAAGQTSFANTCGNTACHGVDGDSGSGAKLSQFVGSQTDEQIAKTIKFGQSSMPGQSTLTDQDIADVLSYLHQLTGL